MKEKYLIISENSAGVITSKTYDHYGQMNDDLAVGNALDYDAISFSIYRVNSTDNIDLAECWVFNMDENEWKCVFEKKIYQVHYKKQDEIAYKYIEYKYKQYAIKVAKNLLKRGYDVFVSDNRHYIIEIK